MGPIYDAFYNAGTKYPDHLFLVEGSSSNLHSLSYGDALKKVEALAGHLASLELAPGSRVVILSESRIEWMIAFLAAIHLGLIIVPLDPKLSEREWESFIAMTEPTAIFASSRLESSFPKLQQSSPCFRAGIYFGVVENPINNWWAFDEHIQHSNLTAKERSENDSASDTAMIAFTSGTAGKALAAQLSEDAIWTACLSIFKSAEATRKLSEREVILCIPPLNHIMGLIAALATMLVPATIIIFPTIDPTGVQRSFKEIRPTQIVAVPAFYERIAKLIEEHIRDKAPRFIQSRMNKYINKDRTDVPRHFWLRKLFFRKLHKALGGRILGLSSGGAAMDRSIIRLFHFVGLPVYEGYGMTECAGVLTANGRGLIKIGTVGKNIVHGLKLRIDQPNEDGIGELCIKGPTLMKGYYRNETANRQAFDDGGWFHTGDLVTSDKDGYITFIGRKKDVIVTSSGKNIYPEELESHFATLASVQDLCVLGLPRIQGSSSEKIHLQIVPSEQIMREKSFESACKQIKNEVGEISRDLPFYKRPTSIGFSKEPLPRTSTTKVRRNVVLQSLIEKADEIKPTGGVDIAEVSTLSPLEKRIIKIIQGLLPPGAYVTPDSHFAMDLGMDSLVIMELWSELESQLHVSIPQKKMAQWSNVQDIINFLTNTKAGVVNA